MLMQPHRHRWPFLITLVALFVAFATYAPSVARQTDIHGIDPADMDLRADPRADFYRFANGGGLDRTEIPPDQGSYGVFEELRDLTIEQQLALLDRLSQGSDLPEGSDEWKAVRLFEQATDLAARDAKGMTPVEPILAEIDAI